MGITDLPGISWLKELFEESPKQQSISVPPSLWKEYVRVCAQEYKKPSKDLKEYIMNKVSGYYQHQPSAPVEGLTFKSRSSFKKIRKKTKKKGGMKDGKETR